MNEKIDKKFVLYLNEQGKSIVEIAILSNTPVFWVVITVREAFKKEIILRLSRQGKSSKEIAAIAHTPIPWVEAVIKGDREHQPS